MEKPLPSPHATTIPSLPRRGVILVVGVLVAVHTFLVFCWISPTNPIRDAVGNDHLSSYINNVIVPFEQSWSVFAPTPRGGGENVKIRAYIGKPGSADGAVTPWFDITGDEDRRVKYLVNPSRFHSATRRLGGNINSAVAKYTPVQRRVVAAGLTTSPRSKMASLLRKSNTQGLAGESNIAQYLLNEEMLTRFGTMYATARWGGGITAVEFLVGHRSVPNFSKRNTDDFLDVPFTYYRIGPRKAMPGSPDAQASFDGYVDQAPAKDRE